MDAEYGTIDQQLEVSERYELHGTATQSILVVRGGVLLLHGTCEDDVIVEAGGEAYIYGTVAGNVANQGGKVEVYGTVGGNVQATGEDTIIDDDATVTGDII